MAEKSTVAAVQREIRPNPKQPLQINAGGRTYKGSIQIKTGVDEKGKDVEEIVESKTRFIPAPVVANIIASIKSGDNPEAVKKTLEKFESKLVPLEPAKATASTSADK